MADAYIFKYHPTNNYGLTQYLLSYPHTQREARVYAKFQGIPTTLKGKTILKAQVMFRSLPNFGLSTCAYAALTVSGSLPKSSWGETSITWNSRPADGSCTGSTTPLTLQKGVEWVQSSSAKWCVFNIADRVACWLAGTPNHGLVIGNYQLVTGYSTPQAHWYTKGSGNTAKPQIYIEYQP